MNTYSGSTVYDAGDTVQYLGSTYRCNVLIGGIVGNDPVAYPEYWDLVAAKGDTGPTGPAGPTGPSGGGSYDQDLNTTSSVVFKSLQSTKVVSAGGFPLDSNGDALIVNANTQTPALVVSNYTAGLLPQAVIRGYGQNGPGVVTTTTIGSAALVMEASRGTHTSPTSVQNGNPLGALGWGGYDGARWTSDINLSPVQMAVLASENWAGNATTATNAGARWFIRSQPLGVQLNLTSRHMDILTSQVAGSAAAPPTHLLLLGQADNATTTLTMSNGVDTHVGHGATNIQSINAKHEIYGVPFEDAAVFTGSISGTALTVTAVTSGILSAGQRVYGAGITSSTFITSIGTTGGGVGTYTVNNSQTVSSMTMNSGADNTTLNGSNALTFVSGRKNGAGGRRNSLKTGDSLGRIIFNGQTANGQSGSGGRGAQIRVNSMEDFSGTARGSRITITSVNSGTTTEANRLILASNGNDYYSDFHTFRNNSNVAALIIDPNTNYFNFGNNDPLNLVTLSSFGENPMYVRAGSLGGRVRLTCTGSEGGVELEANGGTQVATFNTATTQIKSDEFNVTMQDNTQLLTAANYGVRIHNGSLWIGDTGEDGVIRTSAAADDLTIQSNDGTTGGKIFLQEGAGVVISAMNTEVANFTTSSIVASTHILPSANDTYDLGSTSSQWRSLYVSTATIYLGGNALSVAGGDLTLNGTAIGIPLITAAATTSTTTGTGKLVSISDTGGKLAYYSSTASEWRYVGTEAVVYSAAPAGDPYYSDVVFLLEASINDDVKGNVTISNNGVTTSTAQTKFGNSVSWLLDGADATNLTINNSIVQMGTGDWTLDMWMWNSSANTTTNALFAWDNEMEYRHESGGDWFWYDFGQGIYPAAFATNPTVNDWTFATFERHGSYFNIYLDGVRVYQGSASSMNINNSTIWFGNEANRFGFAGHFDYIRLTDVARHSGSNFTPPTSAADYDPL
jgi:hypothetical protein